METLAKWLGLETFGDPEIEELARLCWRFARALSGGQPPFWLTLLGKSGTGKTHCAKRLWEKLHFRFSTTHTRYPPRFIYWPRFIEELRERIRENVGVGEFLDMGRWPLLVIDDAMAERDTTGFSADKLNTLLGTRIGKWTILTGNLGLADISKIDDRIASRIVRGLGNLVIEMKTEDFGVRVKG
jgi:DNA replication protein DnaC